MAEPKPRFITPEGLRRIRSEYDELFGTERPKIVETVSGPRRSATARKMPITSTASAGSARSTGGSRTSPES